MTENELKLDGLVHRLNKEMGGQIRGMSFVEGTTKEQRVQATIGMVESILDGKMTRVEPFNDKHKPFTI